MEVEQIILTRIAISNGHWESLELDFTEAKLLLVTQYGDKLWYIDADGVANSEVLDWFAASEDISVSMEAVSSEGEQLQGNGFLHPNTAHKAAAIRGSGELKRSTV
ncbi:hypothetical protein [Paenibacillus oryzae]|uniref:hypothetical protein n=1 Tax=Paenibacillus oryzae TaxID=1844972 RepID=UPI001FDEA499|nr:hypothetical protein [Paenibacillus oryzae]